MTKQMILGMAVLASVAVLTVTASPTPANAFNLNLTKKQFCKIYAAKATRQFYKNVNLECSFSGAYWHPAKNLHKIWCMGVHRQTALEGNRYRARKLNRCLAEGDL